MTTITSLLTVFASLWDWHRLACLQLLTSTYSTFYITFSNIMKGLNTAWHLVVVM